MYALYIHYGTRHRDKNGTAVIYDRHAGVLEKLYAATGNNVNKKELNLTYLWQCKLSVRYAQNII